MVLALSLTFFPKTDDFTQSASGNTINNRVRIFVRLFWQFYLMLLTQRALSQLIDELVAEVERGDLWANFCYALLPTYPL
jgi:hypothetical protein